MSSVIALTSHFGCIYLQFGHCETQRNRDLTFVTFPALNSCQFWHMHFQPGTFPGYISFPCLLSPQVLCFDRLIWSFMAARFGQVIALVSTSVWRRSHLKLFHVNFNNVLAFLNLNKTGKNTPNETVVYPTLYQWNNIFFEKASCSCIEKCSATTQHPNRAPKKHPV